MKKIPFLVAFMVAALSANVLIEDFEDNDRSSLLDPKDAWFVFSDSSDAGCQEQLEGYPCSVFNTFYMDFQFDDWSYEPREFTYEAEVPETTYVAILDTTVSDTTCVDTVDTTCVAVIDTVGMDTVIKKVVADRDTLMYFPLRSESPFNSADKKNAGPKSSTLEANDTYVGGFYYQFGSSYLVYDEVYNPTYDDYDYAPQYWFLPYVAMGLKTNGNGVTYDLSKCTGISYKYRGAGHLFRADLSTVKDYNYHFVKVNESKAINDVYGTYQGWSTVTIKWTQLAQESGWGTKRAFNAAKIEQLVWMVKGGNQDNVYGSDFNAKFLGDRAILGISPDIGDLAIDDVTCITSGTEIPVGPVSSSSKAVTSSSSKGSDSFVAPQKLSVISGVQVSSNGISFVSTASAKVYFFDYQGRLMNATAELPVGANFVSLENLPQGRFVALIRSRGYSTTLQVRK